MFSWFKKRRDVRAAQTVLAGTQAAINRLGFLMETYPGEIMDEKWLPLPKTEMKAALKIGWITAKDEKERALMKVGWMLLSSFQPNVGDTPISAKLPPNPSPEEAIKILTPYLEISPRAEEEMAANSAEFDAFVNSQSRLTAH